MIVGGTGTGTVTSAPVGINCWNADGSDCQQSYPVGTSVTLTATPDPGSIVGGWSLPTCSGATCTGSMQAGTMQIEATFLPSATDATKTMTITALGSPPGSGAIVATPHSYVAAVGMGARNWLFETDLTVTLNAFNAAKQPVAVQWANDCASAGTATSCTIVMSQARTVSATFPPPL